MLKKSNNRAISCSREFGQWLFMSLMALVLLSAFPIMGSANDSYIVGVVFLDANENGVYDPDESVKVGHDVYLKDLNGGNFHTPTNEKGEFYFTARNVGDYEISIDLNEMELTTPFYAKWYMPPHKISVTEKGQTVQVDFGLSGNTKDIFVKNKDNSYVLYNNQYGLRVTPKAEGHDAEELAPMQVQQTDVEAYVGNNNTADVFLAPNTSTPLGGGTADNTRRLRDGKDEFTVIVGKNISTTGAESVFNVTKNPDGSLSLVNPQEPTVTTTIDTNGDYTIVDSEFPTHVVTIGDSGNLVVSDSEFPDSKLSVAPDGTKTVTDTEFTGVELVLNEDETYAITDQEFPELVAVYNPVDGSYVVEDKVENLTVHIDQAGNYTVIDNESGSCLVVPQLRWNPFKKIGSFINKIAKFVAKVANFIKKVATFIKKALPVVIKVLKVISVVTAIVAPLFPPLCPVLCAISAFTGKAATFLEASSPAINAFLDEVIDIAGKVENGANKVADATEPEKDGKRGIRRSSRDSLNPPLKDDCISPPGLVLDYLVGATHDSHIVLTWATVAEFNNQGFNVWRATEKNEAGELINLTQVNAEMIQAQSDAQWGATYSFTDESILLNQTYYYVIESIDSDGISTKQMDFIAEVKSAVQIGEQPACQLYGVQDEALNDSYFFVHDLMKNATHKLGEVCKGCDIEAMAVHPLTYEIFVASGDNAQDNPKGYLYKFNPETGKLIHIGATGFRGVTSLTFDQNATLWAWAEHEGLGQINPETGEGTLLVPFSLKVGDLTWSDDKSVLYASVGSQLWEYVPETGKAAMVCNNLPPKTEALVTLPPVISLEGYLLLGSHKTGFQLHAFDAANCQSVITRDIEVPYDDVEGLAISNKACVNY